MTESGTRRSGSAGPPPGAKPRPRWRLALATIAVSLAVALAVAEIAVRILGVAPPLQSPYRTNIPDPYVPFKPRPNSVVSEEVEERNNQVVEYRHNSAGFRDVEHALAKPPGVFRILGLGDSFTYGALTDFQTTYLYRLEQMLNQRPGEHPKVEIIKTGVSRYWTLPERLLFEHYGAAYSPDLVLVGFLPNDVIDSFYGLDAVTVDASGYLKTREAAELGRVGMFFYKHSHLARLVLRTYVGYRLAWKHPADGRAIYQDNGKHEKDWQEVEKEFGKIVEIASRLPAKVVIVYIPQKGPWTEREDYPAKRLGAWAAAHGAGIVDVLPAMIREAPKTKLYLEEGHCTPEGYGIIAQEIDKYLTANALVP